MTTPILERRTSADDIFDDIKSDIVALKLLPGARMSEVEIAKRFGVSRQPVRDAFIRLSNQGLLLIRPQKATVVRKFSQQKIDRARFIRMAVEVEVLRRACRRNDPKRLDRVTRNLEQQKRAVDRGDVDGFHALDYEFHRLLCTAADCEFVFETIADNKAQVDRLCVLSLSVPAAMEELLQDHANILNAIGERDENAVTEAIQQHLGRLDETIKSVRWSHTDYFED